MAHIGQEDRFGLVRLLRGLQGFTEFLLFLQQLFLQGDALLQFLRHNNVDLIDLRTDEEPIDKVRALFRRRAAKR